MKNAVFPSALAMLMITAFCLGSYADDQGDKDHGKSTHEKKYADIEKKDADIWMQAKLKYSQGIFEGLMNGDFAAVEKNASAMRMVGYLEWWLRNNDYVSKSTYQAQLNRFDFSNRELIRLAGDKDINGAATTYTDLSLTCVRCHTLIRDADHE